jgi:hypothetical protein
MNKLITAILLLAALTAVSVWTVGCAPQAEPGATPSATVPTPPPPPPAPEVAPPANATAPPAATVPPPKPAEAPKHRAAPAKPTSTSAPKPAAKAAVIWTCPMHPEVQSDKPGKCPKCGMPLVQKTS